MKFSFDHLLRGGDGVVNAVLAIAAEMGLKNLKVTLS
jgi:citrate lyase subunit alpha / citrate CoA-transferase